MKRTIFAVAFATLICSLTGFAQPDTVWTRTYEIGGNILEMFETSDNGVLVVLSNEYAIQGFKVSKFSADGDSLWTHEFGQNGLWGRATSASLTLSGVLYVLSDSSTSGGLDEDVSRLFKIGVNGDLTESVELADTAYWSEVAAMPDGGVALSAVYINDGDAEVLISRRDENFEAVWTTLLSDSLLDVRAWRISANPNGQLLLTGSAQGHVGNIYHVDPFVTFVDNDGDVLWSHRFDNTGNNWIFIDDCVASNDYCWAAGTMDEFDFPYNYYGRFIKFSLNGDSLWDRFVRSPVNYSSMITGQITLFNNGDGLISAGVNNEPALLRMSSSGENLWLTTSETPIGDSTIGWSAQAMSDESYISATSYFDNTNTPRLRLVRSSPDIVAAPSVHELPSLIVLHPNYPNPFNPTTEISFELPRAMNVSLRVFDLLGREVAVLVNGDLNAGTHRVEFDGKELASGVYFYRLDAGEFLLTRKMVMLK